MKTKLTRIEAREKIDSFFKSDNFKQEGVKKIKRLAMKFNIKLGSYRKLFCKKCLNFLEGKIRVNKNYKSVECVKCGYLNNFMINFPQRN